MHIYVKFFNNLIFYAFIIILITSLFLVIVYHAQKRLMVCHLFTQLQSYDGVKCNLTISLDIFNRLKIEFLVWEHVVVLVVVGTESTYRLLLKRPIMCEG